MCLIFYKFGYRFILIKNKIKIKCFFILTLHCLSLVYKNEQNYITIQVIIKYVLQCYLCSLFCQTTQNSEHVITCIINVRSVCVHVFYFFLCSLFIFFVCITIQTVVIFVIHLYINAIFDMIFN